MEVAPIAHYGKTTMVALLPDRSLADLEYALAPVLPRSAPSC